MPALQKEMQASSTSNFRYFTCLLDKGHIRKSQCGFFGINFHSDKIKNFINFCILLFHKDFYILKL